MGQKSHDAGALDGGRKLSLVPSTDASAAAREHFHVEIHETAQSAGVFVVNIQLISAEVTIFVFFDSHNFTN